MKVNQKKEKSYVYLKTYFNIIIIMIIIIIIIIIII